MVNATHVYRRSQQVLPLFPDGFAERQGTFPLSDLIFCVFHRRDSLVQKSVKYT